MSFTFIDLFAGVGGFRKALEAVGGTCILSSEIDKFCIKTYRANFTVDHPIAGDIREMDEQETPYADLLVGGFPCPSFSIPGIARRAASGAPSGLDDTVRGTLFFEIMRLAEAMRPKMIFLENVENLVVHDKRRTFQRMRRAIEDLGYTFDVRVVDAQGFVPQRRNRVYILAIREPSVPFRLFQVPLPEKGPTLGSILHTEPVPEKYTISEKAYASLQKRQGGSGLFGYRIVGPDDIASTLTATYDKDPRQILVRQEGNRPRRLTPRECSRLMGFDTPQGSEWMIPVSDTQAYRQFGNAVVVPLVRSLAQRMIEFL